MGECAKREMQILGMAMVVMASLVHSVQGTWATGPKQIVLYAHESLVPPTLTLVTSAAPSGNLTMGNEEFGVIKVVSNVLRSSSDPNSTVIGSQVGIVVLGKDVLDVYLSYTYFLNENSTYKGTIAVHGHINARLVENRLFAVVGGTGDFLFATGQDESPPDTVAADPSHIVNIHTLTLAYAA